MSCGTVFDVENGTNSYFIVNQRYNKNTISSLSPNTDTVSCVLKFKTTILNDSVLIFIETVFV